MTDYCLLYVFSLCFHVFQSIVLTASKQFNHVIQIIAGRSTNIFNLFYFIVYFQTIYTKLILASPLLFCYFIKFYNILLIYFFVFMQCLYSRKFTQIRSQTS